MISPPALQPTDADDDSVFLPVSVLLFASIVELIIYRFFASVNAYAGVGSLGVWARLADTGTIALLFTGVLSVILLISSLARLIHNRSLPGLLWRGVIVMIAPVYLLVMIWSIWTPLTGVLLLGAVAAALFTILLIIGAGLSLPVPRLTRGILMAMAFMMIGAAAAWVAQDLLEVDRLSMAGSYSHSAAQMSELFLVLAPPVLFFSLLFPDLSTFRSRLFTPHIPAFVAAVIITASAAGLILWSQVNAGQELQLTRVTDFLVRMSTRTLGVTLSSPFGLLPALISLFFLVLLITSLLVPYRTWKTDAGKQNMAFGLAFIHIAGLQPFTVYLLALSLLGFTLFITGLAEKFPWASAAEYESLKKTATELDGAVTKENSNGVAKSADN